MQVFLRSKLLYISICLLFVSVTNTWDTQLKGGKVYFGHSFRNCNPQLFIAMDLRLSWACQEACDEAGLTTMVGSTWQSKARMWTGSWRQTGGARTSICLRVVSWVTYFLIQYELISVSPLMGWVPSQWSHLLMLDSAPEDWVVSKSFLGKMLCVFQCHMATLWLTWLFF